MHYAMTDTYSQRLLKERKGIYCGHRYVQGHRLAPPDLIERSEATRRFVSPVHPVVRC